MRVGYKGQCVASRRRGGRTSRVYHPNVGFKQRALISALFVKQTFIAHQAPTHTHPLSLPLSLTHTHTHTHTHRVCAHHDSLTVPMKNLKGAGFLSCDSIVTEMKRAASPVPWATGVLHYSSDRAGGTVVLCTWAERGVTVVQCRSLLRSYTTPVTGRV